MVTVIRTPLDTCIHNRQDGLKRPKKYIGIKDIENYEHPNLINKQSWNQGGKMSEI